MTYTVAVVMAAYNADRTLPEAVASVLASTLPVQLIVVDDASHVAARDVLVAAFDEIPTNVTVIRSEANLGASGARNLGLRHAIDNHHRYVAVLDADDLAHHERFAKQAADLEANPVIAAAGTWANWVDENTGVVTYKSYPPLSPETIRKYLCFDCCIVNTSVMFRVSALQDVGLWDESLRTAEDYDLFCRLARRYDLANMPEYLVDYRLLRGGLSLGGVMRQRRARLLVQLRHFPYRYDYWQAWAGVLLSAARVITPTFLVDEIKRIIRRPSMFEYRHRTS
jgi:glycosyltransferase involved in cell wall biosynthesis